MMQLNGWDVSRETYERLELFVHLFMKWARTINLVAPSTLPRIWHRHVADSAQIFQLRPKPGIWVDLGSGGGFPGIITAIFLRELGEGWVHLVESNQKKAAFLRQALLETGASGSVHVGRIEDAVPAIGSVNAISARALADLDLLFDYIEPWMGRSDECRAYLHKGRDYQREKDKANSRWSFDLIEHASAVEADSVILEVVRLQRIAN